MQKRLAATFLAMLVLLVQALPAVACAAKCSMGHCDEPKQSAPTKPDHGCCDEERSSEPGAGHQASDETPQHDSCNCGCEITSTPNEPSKQAVATVQVQVFPVLAILAEPIEAPNASIVSKLAGIRTQDSGPPGKIFLEQSHSRAPPFA